MKPAALAFLVAAAGCTAQPIACEPLPIPPVPPASVVRRPAVKPAAPAPDIARAAIEYATRPDATAEGIAAYRAILNNR